RSFNDVLTYIAKDFDSRPRYETSGFIRRFELSSSDFERIDVSRELHQLIDDIKERGLEIV
ncbi:MAG: hypothetical protein AAFO69_19190, partial [Bacteroidota bacterium]